LTIFNKGEYKIGHDQEVRRTGMLEEGKRTEQNHTFCMQEAGGRKRIWMIGSDEEFFRISDG
jgi:hypothetical protein